jgi:coenzyme F420-reducing hydrogenase beta subunit
MRFFRQRIVYTLGLFCGHMKSARFVDSISRQAGVKPEAVAAVDYRVKTPGRPANWYRAKLSLADGSKQEEDWWHLADGDWGAGFFQNSACNFCDDVVAETADIAFGDAWVEPHSSDPDGTNVVIVRKPEPGRIVRDAVDEGRLSLRQVGAGFVKETQAAGLRQRREGLVYRLAWKPPAFPLRKRVEGDASGLPMRRKLIYRMRYSISRWSHPMFALGRITGLPALYTWWARTALWLYHGLAYSRGVAARALDALLVRSTG